MKSRIAHVGPDPHRPGGMAAVIRDIFASPLADRYSLDLIVTYRSRNPVVRAAVFARALVRLVRWCRGDGPRLVHVHTAVRGSIVRKSICAWVARRAGRPVVLQLHAGAGDIDAYAGRIGPLRRRLIGRGMRAADAILSVSAPGARRIEEAFGVDSVTVVPNAAPAVRPDALAARSNGHAPRALYMGGFVNPAKGGAVLVRALPRLLDECPGLEVTLAGTGTPPPELVELERRDERVRWAGWLDQEAKERELAGCDVFVMPSLSEGMPVALLEAMTWGRAIVASDVGGIPDVVGDGSEAILVPAADEEALCAGVARAAADGELRARLGDAARERAKGFDRDEVYGRIAAIYDSLLATGR